MSETCSLVYYYIKRRQIQDINMNATTATRNRRMEGTYNVCKGSFNVTFLHALPSSSLKLAPKLEPAHIELESLPQDLQYHIPSHMATMLNLFADIKEKQVGMSKFNETEN